MNVCKHDGEVLQDFAKTHNLRVTRDECNDPVVLGSRGELYQYGPSEIGLMILPTGDNPSPRLWDRVLAKCKESGMTLRQNGDAEGAFSFDHENDGQARLAIKSAGIRSKKKLSEEHKRKLLEGKKRYEHQNFALKGILEGVSCP